MDRTRDYDAVAAELPAVLDRFAERYVALPAGWPRPAALGAG